jgi:hypothetical protein
MFSAVRAIMAHFQRVPDDIIRLEAVADYLSDAQPYAIAFMIEVDGDMSLAQGQFIFDDRDEAIEAALIQAERLTGLGSDCVVHFQHAKDDEGFAATSIILRGDDVRCLAQITRTDIVF